MPTQTCPNCQSKARHVTGYFVQVAENKSMLVGVCENCNPEES